MLEGEYLQESAVIEITFPSEDPMRGIFNGTITRSNGDVDDYNFQVYATGSYF